MARIIATQWSRHPLTLALALALVLGGSATAQEYTTGFEPPEFNLGPIDSTGQEGWRLIEGTSASIQNETVFAGMQALEVGPGSAVDRSLQGLITGDLVWIDAWAQVNAEDAPPDPATLGTGSSLVHFSNTMGIACLDGDGSGGGTWVSTGVDPTPGSWVRVTIAQNYQTQTWACYVDNSRVLTDLGFKDNLTELSGFTNSAGEASSAFLDDFSVQSFPPDFAQRSFATLFEFASVWQEMGFDQNETAFQYDYDEDNSIQEADLLQLIPSLVNEPDNN